MTTQVQAEGFYVTVRHGTRAGFLLGPYTTHGEALGNVERARRYALKTDGDAVWYEFGTAKATAKPGRELKPGRLNNIIGLTAAEKGTREVMSEATEAVGRLLDKWQAARVALQELERAEHPDITDRFGRVWAWRGRGDLYRHDGMAFPKAFVVDDAIGLPSQAVLDNPNHGHLCAVCLNGRTRNVPACKPEWNCSHAMHQR